MVRYVSLSGLLIGILLYTGIASGAPDPTEQMRPFLKKVTDILSTSREDAKCDLCLRVIDVAKERFDFHEMSKRVLGKQWRNLSQEEKEKFVDLFTRLLQHAYINKIGEYAGTKIEFTNQRIKGNRAEVRTLLIDKGKTIPVSYIMILKKDQWMAYDVVVEGVSLVRNYMEQFREILRTESYQSLVNKIEEKLNLIETETIKEG